MWGKRAAWLTVVLLASLDAGCSHTSDHERMDELLHQSEDFGPPGTPTPQQDAESHRLTPERIHGGII